MFAVWTRTGNRLVRIDPRDEEVKGVGSGSDSVTEPVFSDESSVERMADESGSGALAEVAAAMAQFMSSDTFGAFMDQRIQSAVQLALEHERGRENASQHENESQKESEHVNEGGAGF